MDIKKLNEEYEQFNEDHLYEMSKAFTEDGWTIWVENPSTHNNAYFKLFDASSPTKATKVARIWLTRPVYVKGHSGLPNWILTKQELKTLIKCLKQPYRKNKEITNWQQMIVTYNDAFCNIDSEDTISGNYEDEDALPIDYPMPDYMRLS